MRPFVHFCGMTMVGFVLLFSSCWLINVTLSEQPMALRVAASIGTALAVQALWRTYILRPWIQWLRRTS